MVSAVDVRLTSLLLLVASCCMAQLHFKSCGGCTACGVGSMFEYGATLLGGGLFAITSCCASLAGGQVGGPAPHSLHGNARFYIKTMPRFILKSRE